MSLQNAFIGSLAADAFSMPMHWYYGVNALDADYGSVTGYHAPYLLIPTVFCGGRSIPPPDQRLTFCTIKRSFGGREGSLSPKPQSR